MTRSITLKELRPKLPKVVESIDAGMERYIVTKHGKPIMMMLGIDDFESMVETIEIMSDKRLVKRIYKAKVDIRKGRAISLDDFTRKMEKKLGKKL